MAENSANDTVVGTLSADDPDAGETFTFSLVDDAGGLFAINGNDIVVAGALDFETATTHAVTVRVTESTGNTFDKAFTVNVSNVSGNIVGDNNANTLLGTSEEDTIQGLGGIDSLQGFAGDDRLDGRADNDTLIGGTGADTFVYTSTADGLDHISDFDGHGGQTDVLEFDHLAFGDGLAVGGLNTGTLDASHFVTDGIGSTDATQVFWYNTDDHTLYYDADGNGGGSAIAIAVLDNGFLLEHTDIVLV